MLRITTLLRWITLLGITTLLRWVTTLLRRITRVSYSSLSVPIDQEITWQIRTTLRGICTLLLIARVRVLLRGVWAWWPIE